MYHLTSGILGGMVAAFALSPLTTDSAGPHALTPLAEAVSVRNLLDQPFAQNYVNRTLKGDRLPVGAEKRGSERSITPVETVCVRHFAVVYRDCYGQILFDTEPLANVMVVARGVALPETTSRDSNHTPVKPVPLERQREPSSTMPIGCESAFSALSERELAQFPTRCVSSIQDGRRLAAVVQ